MKISPQKLVKGIIVGTLLTITVLAFASPMVYTPQLAKVHWSKGNLGH